MRARIGDGLPDDLLVAKMHAVEKTDGQADLAPIRLQLTCGVDDFHAGKAPTFKLQAPEKFQAVSSKRSETNSAGNLEFET
jgi:hypothetical protein